MSRIQERKKQRQEYLRQKSRANSRAAIRAVLLIYTAILTFMLVLVTFILLFISPFASVVTAVPTVVFGYLTKSACKALKQAEAEACIPYVPPVTPDTLPAEEVLVRSSERPEQAQSEVLVRPVVIEEETKVNELLRSTSPEPHS